MPSDEPIALRPVPRWDEDPLGDLKIPDAQPVGKSSASIPEQQSLLLQALYARYRPLCGTREKTLLRLSETLKHRDKLPAYAPQANAGLLDDWEREEDWERQYEKQEIERRRATGELSPLTLLDHSIEASKNAREHLLRTLAHIQDVGATKDNVDILKKLWSILQEANQEIDRRAAVVERITLESTSKSTFGKEVEEEYAKIQTHYSGLGPQYDTLCRSLATITIKLRHAYESGRDVPADEFAKMHTLQLTFVSQLQKHTETMKSESLSKESQEIINQVMLVVRDRVQNQYPQLWLEIVNAVRARVEQAA